jgi:hypothetical protein
VEKLIIVHSDWLLSTRHKLDSFKAVAASIDSLLGKANSEGKTVERIDDPNKAPKLGSDIYVIGDGVSARTALSAIQPGDSIRVAGLYRDVCVNFIDEAARRMGVTSHIVEGATIEMEPDKWI